MELTNIKIIEYIVVCVDDPLNKIVKTMISNVFFLLNYRYFILKILFGGYKYIELFHKFVCMLLFKIKFKWMDFFNPLVHRTAQRRGEEDPLYIQHYILTSAVNKKRMKFSRFVNPKPINHRKVENNNFILSKEIFKIIFILLSSSDLADFF